MRGPTWRRRGATSCAMKLWRKQTWLRPRFAMTRSPLVQQDEADVLSAQANAKYYADQIVDTEIKSPVDGVIVSKALEVGEWVTPGVPILTVDDLSTIWARVDVEETDLGSLYIGKSAQVRIADDTAADFQRPRDGDRAGRRVRDRARRAARAPGHPHLLRQGAGVAGRRRTQTRDDRGSHFSAQ